VAGVGGWFRALRMLLNEIGSVDWSMVLVQWGLGWVGKRKEIMLINEYTERVFLNEFACSFCVPGGNTFKVHAVT